MKDKIKNNFTGNFKPFFEKYLQKIQKIGGDEFKAICPFHDDTNPSFNFNNQSGKYFCHGCGKKGDIFHFYGKINSLNTGPDFGKILKGIADDFGIPFDQKKARIVKTYDYTDAGGNLLFQVCRMEPKDFRQRQPDGKGGWFWNLKGIDRVLYRLPEVLKADEVIIVEGERDADNLASLGFTATTCPMGAGKWRDEYNYALKGKGVVLIPDNDNEGREHMAGVGASLKGVAKSLKWIDLPDLPSKGDVSDFMSTFDIDLPFKDPEQAAERLAILIENARPYKPKKSEIVPKIEVISVESMADMEIEEKPVIDGLLCEKESLIISGASGVGKSLFINHIALSLGNPPKSDLWRLFNIPKPIKSLIVQSENSLTAQVKRYKKLFNAHPEMLPGAKNVFTIKTGDDCRVVGSLTDQDFQKLLVDSLLSIEAENLILDPLISYHGEDENDNAAMRRSLDCLTLICDQVNVAVILCHHYNRQNLTRGAASIRDWAANMLLMDIETREADSTILRITHDKARNYEQQDDFYLERTPDLQFLRCEKPGGKFADQIDAVVTALTEMGGRVDSQAYLKDAIMLELNCKEYTARKAIERALEMKKIIIIPKTGKGNPHGYKLPE